MASSSDKLFITYVDVDHDLLKIWGQRSRIAATYIEKQLLQLRAEINRAPIPNPAQIHKGMFCFAKYTDDNYYRARVISVVHADSVRVLFVDCGIKDIIKLSNIRIKEGHDGDVLAKMAEQAEEYYLAGAAAPPSGWTKEIVSEIRRDICYDNFPYQIVAQVGDQKILEIQFSNEDFTSYLVRKQLASFLPLPAQKQIILTYCSLVASEIKPESVRDTPRVPFSPSIPPPNMRIPSRPPNERVFPLNHEKKNQVNFSQPPPPLQYPSHRSIQPGIQHINQNVPKNSYFPPVNHLGNPVPISASSPIPMDPVLNPILNNQFNPLQMVKEQRLPFNNTNSNIIQLLAQQVKQYIAEDNAKTESETAKTPHHYVNSVLEVGNTYNVFISFIDDGPWSFSIQLLSSETELQKLMDELSSTELVPIKPPIILGRPCIASSALYGNLCRGVVVSISHCAVKVYFVDFGNTEDLPSSSIYELPPKFFKIRVLSQKFSLSGLQKVVYSEDIKQFFKEVVQDELLMLRVTSLEDDNLPTCELYLKDKNIKRILNEKIREFRTTVDDFPKVGDTENVLVTWIVSPQKFFVQLQKRDLSGLKKELSEVEAKGQKLTYQQLSVGFKCVCQYKNDGQWYRAVITSVDSENAITVFYVDYGNTEVVSISQLRRVGPSGLINQMGNQAIQCTLKGFEDKPADQELTNKLEGLILEKELQMKVVSLDKEPLCVQLFENGRDIAAELLIATPPKLNLLETSSQNQSDVLSVWSSPVSADSKEKEKKVSDAGEFSDRTRSTGPRGDRNRQKFKKGQQLNNLQNLKFPIRETPAQSKRRGEPTIETWRDDKTRDNNWNEPSQNSWKPRKQNENGHDWDNQNSKFGGWKGNRDDRKENDRDWDNQNSKFGGWKGNREDWNENGKPERNRGARPPRSGFEHGYDEKKHSDDRKFVNGEGRRFDGNRGRDVEFRKRFDRNDDRKRNESSRKPVRREDAVPPGSKFEEKVLEVNACERGIVTYYFSPHEFYVQLLSQEEEFKKMMADIQVYYSDKYSLRDPVQKGDIVIAQFSLDKVLYRAEVIKPAPVTVRYVDYGNQEPVPPKGIWSLAKQFSKLPKQVIKCRLSNIQPIGLDWPPPDSGIEKFFELSEYKCTFLSFDGDIYEISMEGRENGRDVAGEIIAAGLAAPKSSALDVPEFDLSLLPKQILRLYISHIESPSKFYVVLNPKASEVIENELRKFSENKKNLIPIKGSLIKPETPCLTTNDDVSWHRGIITKTDGKKVSVRFSDRGDSIDVTVDKVMNLPDYLKVFQPQAVECTLYGTPGIGSEEFKKTVKGKHHLVSIVSVVGDRLSVVLYNEEGEKLGFENSGDFPQAVEPVGQLPIISQKLSVMISHLETPEEIYVQRSSDWEDLENLSNQLANHYSVGEGGSDVNEEAPHGTLVAAKSVVYDTWYRGRLISSSDEGPEVFYIDYGNKEVLPRENLKKLDSGFMKANALCRKLVLDAEFEADKAEDLKIKILELCVDKELSTYFRNDDGEFKCEFICNGERVTPQLKSVGLLNESNIEVVSSKKPPKETLPEQRPTGRVPNEPEPEADELKVFVSHIDSPKLFWVHKENTINELQKFQDKLQKSCEDFPVKDNPRVGDVVAAVFSNTWYRARVKKVEGSVISVQFIDYGNSLDVDLSSSSVKELTDEFIHVPVFATPFALRGTWSEDLTPKFEEMILRNEDPVTVVVLEESDPAVVDLFRSGQSFTEMLRESAEEDGKEEGGEGERSDCCTAYITFSHSPDDFYVQRESCTDVLTRLTEQLLDGESFERPPTIEVNEVYAAKYPEDGNWYRARVTKNDGDEIEVHFVDYGNSSKVSEVKCLPGDLNGIADLAERCGLLYGDSCDEWSEAACEKFAEFADGRELKMRVAVKTSRKLLVDLFHGNLSVREELGAVCEKDGRVEAYVSHAVSPTDFYIHYADDEEYKMIEEKLENGDEAEDLEERTPGTLCQARFVNDGYWYRAKILRNLDNGCEVFFLDFGDVAFSTDLKKLPEEVKDIPPKALRCSLKLPKTNIPESATDEFIGLAARGEAVFRVRVILPGEINIISLKLGGRILEETLNLDEVEETNDCNVSGSGESFPETEGGKESKESAVTGDYVISDLTGELTGGSADEEKTGKAEISEDFKSGNDGMSPYDFAKTTDKEFPEKESASELSNEDSRDEGLEIGAEVEEDANESAEKSSEESGVSSVECNTNEVSDHFGIVNGSDKVIEHLSKEKTFGRNKVHKIVPGCISRGEEEDTLSDTSEPTYQKINYSEKLVPGSVSRGVVLESTGVTDQEALDESPEEGAKKSPPTTPGLTRKSDANGYVKIDPSDRLVPGCISTGAPLMCSPGGEKIPATEKIVSGTVNGSFESN